MKKIFLLASLLAFQDNVNANCCKPTNTSNFGEYTAFIWIMDIKNSTPHDLVISGSCAPSGPVTLLSGAHQPYQGPTLCSNHADSVCQTQCTVTDKDTQESVILTTDYIDCITLNTEVTPSERPSPHLAPYNCQNSWHNPGDYPNTCGGHYSTIHTNVQTTYFEVAYKTTYTLVWEKVLMNLAQGQAMANKLGHDLLTATKSDTLDSASYNDKTQRLSIALTKSANGNPYMNADGTNKDGEACKIVNESP